MRSSGSWWASRVRQFRAHLGARVTAEERAELATWLTPSELALFDAMHVADQRHGLDVVATLRRRGAKDRDLLVAGLLHDCGKGRTGVVPRVLWSLAEAYGGWVLAVPRRLPPLRSALERLRDHAETSARLVHAAGGTERTVELIRWQDAPRDPVDGVLLKQADEAN